MPIPPSPIVPPTVTSLESFLQAVEIDVNGVRQVLTTSDGVQVGPRKVNFVGSGCTLDNANLAIYVPIGSATPATAAPRGPVASWLVTDWWIDPAGTHGGSDTNAGTSSGAPLRTFRQMATLWQTTSPILSQATTIHVMSDQADASDPFAFEPLSGPNATAGVALYVVGAPAAIASGPPPARRACRSSTRRARAPSRGWTRSRARSRA